MKARLQECSLWWARGASLAAVLVMLATACLVGVRSVKAAQTCVVGSGFATVAAAVADSACTRIEIPAGTWPAQDVHVSRAGVTIVGASQSTTILDGAGVAALWIENDDITISDLTVKDGSQGIRFDRTSAPIMRTTIDRVTVSDNSSYGIEVTTNVTVMDAVVKNSTMARNSNGFRFSSRAIGNRISVKDSLFTSNLEIGFYQANDEYTGYIDGLEITGCTFTGNDVGIYGEELRNVDIAGNSFDDTLRAFTYLNYYNLASATDGNITFRNNTLASHREAAIILYNYDALEEPITVADNTITQDIAERDWSQIIDIRLKSSLVHAPVRVTGNTVTLTGTGSTYSNWAVFVRGDYNGVEITGNTFNGNGKSGPDNRPYDPPSSGTGILIRTKNASFGGPTPSSRLKIQNNVITGFRSGISFIDDTVTPPVFGNLPATAGENVQIRGNYLEGNADYAVRLVLPAGGTPLDAQNNWWGAADGPPIGSVLSGSVTSTPWITGYDSDDPTVAGFYPVNPRKSSTLSAGSNVSQSFESLTGVTTAALTFANVVTTGVATVVEYTSTASLPQQPTGFSLGDPPVYFEIDTTAVFSGAVEVCFTYPSGSFPAGTTPKLYHFTSGSWKDVTTSHDASTRTICGSVTAFSPFAVGKVNPPPDPVPPTSTTTTTPPTTTTPSTTVPTSTTTVPSTPKPAAVATTKDLVQRALPEQTRLLTTVRLIAKGDSLRSLLSRTPETCVVLNSWVLALREGRCAVEIVGSTATVASAAAKTRVLTTLETVISKNGMRAGLALVKKGTILFKKYSPVVSTVPDSIVQGAQTARGVVLVGHTAIFTGNGAENSKLSRDRAFAVREYLIEKRVRPSLIFVRGLAARQPISRARIETAQVVNRRVDVYFLT